MKNFIIVMLIFFSIPASGQTHFIGIKGGIARTNIASSDNLFKNTNTRIRFTGGMTYNYLPNKKYNLAMEFLYEQKGFSLDLTFTDETGNPTGEKAIIKYNYDYLSLPIKSGLVFGEQISGFINLGFVPSVLINAKVIEPKIEGITDERTLNVTDRVKRFDLGALIEMGGNYKFKKNLILSSSFAYQQGFMSITNKNYYSDKTARHREVILSLGLKYKLF